MAITLTSHNKAGLYQVYVVDKTVINDDEAVHAFYIRADSPEQARIKAVLRDKIEEAYLDDYDIITYQIGYVSKVSEDAE